MKNTDYEFEKKVYLPETLLKLKSEYNWNFAHTTALNIQNKISSIWKYIGSLQEELYKNNDIWF